MALVGTSASSSWEEESLCPLLALSSSYRTIQLTPHNSYFRRRNGWELIGKDEMSTWRWWVQSSVQVPSWWKLCCRGRGLVSTN